MTRCGHCAAESAEQARFCWSCGAPLGPSDLDRGVRKTVTVLFCDLVGSTAVAEYLDPEQVHRILSRYSQSVAGVVRAHGGTIEKFIGDAVMAVFGMPLQHEDDATRAICAGIEIQRTLKQVSADLAHVLPAPLEVRIGINTGEVLARDPGRGDLFASGDAVNLAQRLESSATPGQILIGPETYRLAKHAVRVEGAPLRVKGKTDPLAAYRLIELFAGTASRPPTLTSPLIGRESEHLLLESALARCVQNRACHLFTLLGQAGVGKSRLATEVLSASGGTAKILTVSCLRYGDAGTFSPIVDLIRQAVGVLDDDSSEAIRGKLTALLGVEQETALIAGRLLEILGVSDAVPVSEGSFWAVRKLLESVARDRPLAVIFDDVTWADATVLDLIDEIADWARGSPILLVCLGRPELVDVRPDWDGGKWNATTVFMEPLSLAESERFLDEYLASAPGASALKNRIIEVTGGNPLFLEEMLARLIEDGVLYLREERWEVRDPAPDIALPTTVQVLVGSRLDALQPEQRRVLEDATIEGKVFHRGAVEALASADRRAGVEACLAALVRKDLIRPDKARFPDETAFRFRHAVIREVAYESMPKATRAEQHRRFAEWLEQVASYRIVEYEEIVGYHLEQAFRYRCELEPVDGDARTIASRAGTWLAAAGRRALARGDVPAAAQLLRRGARLYEFDDGNRADVLLDLGIALGETGDFREAMQTLETALEQASVLDSGALKARVLIELSNQSVLLEPHADVREVLDVAEQAISVFQAAADDAGLARALSHKAQVHWTRCRCGEMEQVLEEALAHAELAGDQRERSRILRDLARATVIGPRPVEAGIRRCHAIAERAERNDVTLAAVTDTMLGVLEALRCNFQAARELCAGSRRWLEDLGLRVTVANLQMYSGLVELMAGQPDVAERELTQGYAVLEQLGERQRLSTTAAFLARACFAQDRWDDAERFTRISEESASKDDVVSQVMWRGTRGRILASKGETQHAEELARAGVALARETDFLILHADALTDLACVEAMLRRPRAALCTLDEAVALYERKGSLVSINNSDDLRRSLRLVGAPS